MLKIRLQQMGSKNRRMFRLVVMEEAKRRDGRANEVLGFFNPHVTPPDITLKKERIAYWQSIGAQLTDGAKALLEGKKSQKKSKKVKKEKEETTPTDAAKQPEPAVVKNETKEEKTQESDEKVSAEKEVVKKAEQETLPEKADDTKT